jgi:hypothetical protein
MVVMAAVDDDSIRKNIQQTTSWPLYALATGLVVMTLLFAGFSSLAWAFVEGVDHTETDNTTVCTWEDD